MNRVMCGFAAALLPGLAAPVLAGTSYTDLYTLGKPAGIATLSFSSYQVAAGGQLAGYGVATATNKNHALLWSAANPGGVDLNPVNTFTESYGFGTSGTQQVGYGSGPVTGNALHALL